MLFFSLPVFSQTISFEKDTNSEKLNPIFVAVLKKQMKSNPLLADCIKPSRHELMYWPYYTLTAAQIEARDSERSRRNSQSVGEQIAGDIIKSFVNTVIYGKKMPPAVIPKF